MRLQVRERNESRVLWRRWMSLLLSHSARNVGFGAKAEKLNASKCFPLYPQDRTSLNAVGMSVSCQQRPKQAKERRVLFGGQLTLYQP